MENLVDLEQEDNIGESTPESALNVNGPSSGVSIRVKDKNELVPMPPPSVEDEEDKNLTDEEEPVLMPPPSGKSLTDEDEEEPVLMPPPSGKSLTDEDEDEEGVGEMECTLCGGGDHYSFGCKYMFELPPNTEVGPQFQVVCQADGTPVDKNMYCSICRSHNVRLRAAEKYCRLCQWYSDHTTEECPNAGNVDEYPPSPPWGPFECPESFRSPPL